MKRDEDGMRERMRIKAMLHQEELLLLYRELDAVNARLRDDLLSEAFGPGDLLDAMERDIQRTMKRDDVERKRVPPQYDV